MSIELSSKSEYTLLALLELARFYTSGESLQIQQIAEAQNIPKRYLEQLLATLRRGGLIKSTRGMNGGYILSRNPKSITLLDALNCVEGIDAILPAWNTDPKTVESRVIYEFWQEAHRMVNSVLQKYTLQDLCDMRGIHPEMAMMYYI
jgi:Rrf2 family protein